MYRFIFGVTLMLLMTGINCSNKKQVEPAISDPGYILYISKNRNPEKIKKWIDSNINPRIDDWNFFSNVTDLYRYTGLTYYGVDLELDKFNSVSHKRRTIQKNNISIFFKLYSQSKLINIEIENDTVYKFFNEKYDPDSNFNYYIINELINDFQKLYSQETKNKSPKWRKQALKIFGKNR